MEHTITLTIDGREYVAVPRATYEAANGGNVDAIAYGRASIGADLKTARVAAGLTQAQLAKALGKSQPLVAQAESGAMRVSPRYLDAVLKACGLPKDWAPKKSKAKR
jgi:DNA-binding XRE family transcriptional regulator